MEEISVTQAAEKLGKTDRTIRNYIKQGRIKARHIENQFGWEYRIFDFGEFTDKANHAEKSTEINILPVVENKAETALQIVTKENLRLWDEYKELREANNRLAYDLGTRDQRIKDLENELVAQKSKFEARKKWWKWWG
jgi:hypothetical protein